MNQTHDMTFASLKKSFLPFSFVSGIALMASCEHCMQCEYKYYDPETSDSLTYTYEEFCGRKAEVEEYKKEAKADAAEVDGKLNCTDRESEFAF